jgi:transposase
MGRPADPQAQYRVGAHVTKGYTYASTQPSYVDPEDGVKKKRHVHWGKLDAGLKFIPGNAFWLASPDERARLIFPDDWDTSEAVKFTGLRHPGRPACDGECRNRMYGDVWLLEQVALKIGLRQDLEFVFDGNSELVDDLLTLAMFPYLTGWTYNRVARWQRNAKTPSSRELTPSVITRLTQAITERHRLELLKLRAARVGKGELCAVDSTSRSAYGDKLADIRWGKNKERPPLEQTTEVVVYSISNHMPLYYRTFPGNIPDSRTLQIIFADLDHAGFKNVVLVTDRGYETLFNLEKYISRGQPMIMCAKTSQKDVLKAIERLGKFDGRPQEMEIDPEEEIYFNQYDVNYQVKSVGASDKKADRLRLNLYFDVKRKANDLVALDVAKRLQKSGLEELLETGGVLEASVIKSDYCYFKVLCDPNTRKIKSFELNEEKVEKALKLSGFFSIMTHKLDFNAMETYHTYRLRDEQEKRFQLTKDQPASDRRRNWSEEGKTGRLFILFISLMLGSYVRHIWKSTNLRGVISSSLELLDEMRSIRCIEHTNRAKVITPFVGAQVDICEAFGFVIPEGCSPIYKSRRKPNRKLGRSRGKRSN